AAGWSRGPCPGSRSCPWPSRTGRRGGLWVFRSRFPSPEFGASLRMVRARPNNGRRVWTQQARLPGWGERGRVQLWAASPARDQRFIMAAKRRNGATPEVNCKPFSFMNRLQEIGIFFQKRSPQHQTMRRLARRLKKAGIPYAIVGAMAVNAHGAERTTKDVDILLTADGLERFRREFVGKEVGRGEGRPRP